MKDEIEYPISFDGFSIEKYGVTSLGVPNLVFAISDNVEIFTGTTFVLS